MTIFEDLECEEIDDHPSIFTDPQSGTESAVARPFPADAACYAIAVCKAAADLLDSDSETRATMVTSLTDSWKGQEADRYEDTVAPYLAGVHADASEALRELAGAISTAWYDSDSDNQQRAIEHPGLA